MEKLREVIQKLDKINQQNLRIYLSFYFIDKISKNIKNIPKEYSQSLIENSKQWLAAIQEDFGYQIVIMDMRGEWKKNNKARYEVVLFPLLKKKNIKLLKVFINEKLTGVYSLEIPVESKSKNIHDITEELANITVLQIISQCELLRYAQEAYKQNPELERKNIIDQLGTSKEDFQKTIVNIITNDFEQLENFYYRYDDKNYSYSISFKDPDELFYELERTKNDDEQE